MSKDPKFKGPELGLRIKRAREAKGFTIKKIASFCGISPATFSHIESGTANITQSQLNKLAQVLTTTDYYLLTGSDRADNPMNKAVAPQNTSQGDAATQYQNPVPKVDGVINIANDDFALTLQQKLSDDVTHIAEGRGETVEDTMQDMLDHITISIRDWVSTNLELVKEKMIETKTMDVEAILAGLSKEEIQKVLSNLKQ